METYKDDAVKKWPAFQPPPPPTGAAAAATINGGAVDPAAAASAAYGYYKANFPDLIPYLQIDAEFINAKHALVSVTINKTKLDPVSFNTTGATTYLNQSLGTRGIYPAPGKVAPIYQGAIGVSDSGVEGVDVTVPAFEFSVRKKFEWVSTAYPSAPDRSKADDPVRRHRQEQPAHRSFF